MTEATSISWPALLALGAGHGINPAMGWLFAVALGLQRGTRRAVWGSLGPLAMGHAAAILATVAIAGLIGKVVPLTVLRWITAALLVGLGLFRLVRSRHITYGGMRVNARELATWSFLMASAHGAGLMVLPLVLGGGAPAPHAGHMTVASLGVGVLQWSGLAAAAVHAVGYLLVTGAVAAVVYERLGLGFLRSAWVNLDLLWAGALLATGIVTVVPLL